MSNPFYKKKHVPGFVWLTDRCFRQSQLAVVAALTAAPPTLWLNVDFLTLVTENDGSEYKTKNPAFDNLRPCFSTNVCWCWQASGDFSSPVKLLLNNNVVDLGLSKQPVTTSGLFPLAEFQKCSLNRKKKQTQRWVLQSVTQTVWRFHCLHVSTSSFWLVLASWV